MYTAQFKYNIQPQVVFYSNSATHHENHFITYCLYIRIIVQLQVEQIHDVQHINILSPPIRLHTITYAYRCDARTMLQPFVAHWLAHVRTPANVRVKIDVNPQNFM